MARLAAALLGRRARRAPSDRYTLRGWLAAPLLPFFDAAVDDELPCPVLAALSGRAARTPMGAVPTDERDAIRRAAEATAMVYGPEAGQRVLDGLRAPWVAYQERASVFRDRINAFEEVMARLEAGLPVEPPTPGDVEPVARLRQLVRISADAAPVVELARIFHDWIVGVTPGPALDARQHISTARSTAGASLFAKARALCASSRTAFLDRERPAAEHVNKHARLRFMLALNDLPLPLPPFGRLDQLGRAAEWIAKATPGRAAELWPLFSEALVEGPLPYPLEALVRSHIPIEIIRRAHAMDALHYLDDLKDRPNRIRRFLDCLAVLGDDAGSWLIDLFKLKHRWVPAVVLTLLRRTQKEKQEDQAAALLALARQLRVGGPLAEHSRSLARALDEWADPASCPAPPGLDETASATGISAALLREVAHHRRLAGHEQPLPGQLDKLREWSRREAAEARYLKERLLADPPDRAHLEARLANLLDPEQATGRLRHAREQAEHRLQRSLPRLRQDSLQRVLDSVYRRHLREALGRDLPPGPLPPAVREALALFVAPNICPALLGSFLDDVLTNRPLVEREPNVSWLQRAAAVGVDTAAWLAGVRATVTISGEPVTYSTERDPLHVLSMGSYFNTCLTLETGDNAASTLINALDVNKQVIYGRRRDGVVMSRKLIGATARGELVGYQTYGDDAGHRPALNAILRDFATACRLRLTDAGAPEVLHPGFWYDDGNEPWDAAGSGPMTLPVPAAVPADDFGRAEWQFVEGARSDNDAALIALAQAHPAGDYNGHPAAPLRRFTADDSSWRIAALVELARRGKGPARIPDDLRVDPAAILTAQGSFAWLDHPAFVDQQQGRSDRLAILLANLPWRQEALTRGLRLVQQGKLGDNDEGQHQAMLPPAALATAGGKEVIAALRATLRMTCLGCVAEQDHWREQMERWVDVLHVVCLRDAEPRPVLRLLDEDSPVFDFLVFKLGQRLVLPGLTKPLRRRLERGRTRSVDLALALGTQGHAADGPPLLEWLRARPGNLALAVAVCRTGHEKAARTARDLWQPGDELIAARSVTALRRELGSPKLAALLTRQARDGTGVEAQQASLELALLGEGPTAEMSPAHQGLATLVAELPARCRKMADNLGWLLNVQERCAAEGVSMIDPRLDCALYALLADESGPRREAFDALVPTLDLERTHRLLFLPALGLLGALMWEQRERAALRLLSARAGERIPFTWGDVLVWLRERSPSRPWHDGAPIPDDPSAWLTADGGAWLSALDGDEARSLLRAAPVPVRLLLLDLAARRMPPDRYESLLAEELALIAWPGESELLRLVMWPQASYRWQRAVMRSQAGNAGLLEMLELGRDRAAWLLGCARRDALPHSNP